MARGMGQVYRVIDEKPATFDGQIQLVDGRDFGQTMIAAGMAVAYEG